MSFKNNLKIEKGTIVDALRQLPTQIYVFGLKQIEIDDTYARAKDQLKIEISKKSALLRQKYKRVGNKSLSEAMIGELVDIDPEIIELREQITKLKKASRLAELKMKSLERKLECMQDIGHNIREESKSGRSKLANL